MWSFLIPLLLGFILNAASAFTAAYARRWGERGGQVASFVLRTILGIPLWVVGLVLAVRTPSPMLMSSGAVATAAGWVLVAGGAALILWALRSLGRRAAAPSTADTLVAGGAYAAMRHPIHAGTFLEFVGLWLLVPSLTVTVACMLGVAWLLIQTWLEEWDLVQRIPMYGQYRVEVPCFIPSRRCQQAVRREVISLRGSLQPLQDQFNAGRDHLRFLALLSPT